MNKELVRACAATFIRDLVVMLTAAIVSLPRIDAYQQKVIDETDALFLGAILCILLLIILIADMARTWFVIRATRPE